MYGHRISSPEPSAVARIMTLAPMYLRRLRGSGRSRYFACGRYLLGSSVANSSRGSVVSAMPIASFLPIPTFSLLYPDLMLLKHQSPVNRGYAYTWGSRRLPELAALLHGNLVRPTSRRYS